MGYVGIIEANTSAGDLNWPFIWKQIAFFSILAGVLIGCVYLFYDHFHRKKKQNENQNQYSVITQEQA